MDGALRNEGGSCLHSALFTSHDISSSSRHFTVPRDFKGLCLVFGLLGPVELRCLNFLFLYQMMLCRERKNVICLYSSKL